MHSALKVRTGVDIGGTFTDVVALAEDGELHILKLPSTPDDYGRAILNGLGMLLRKIGVPPGDVIDIVHATTVATNTVLEMRGARTALVTTAGFRDVLEMRRLRIPEMYNLQYEKPQPLVPRRLRFEVPERIGPDGKVRQILDQEKVRRVALRIAQESVEAVAICLLHAHANDAHERRVEEILREMLGEGVYISRSSAILPEIREYERTSTTVVNAYIGPVVQKYLGRLEGELLGLSLKVPLRIVQSNGGAMTAANATVSPAYILESGPAAGVIACARVAAQAGIADAISFDMGGTTAKAAIIESGEPARTTEYEVGAGVNISSRLVKGGGYAVKLPFIDVSEIGAGGGSIVALGPENTIAVGPRSAGAVPGPACYARGGQEPTFTDAMVVLGYLNQTHLLGGTLPIDAELARQALERAVAKPLGKPLLDAAYGVYALAAATMTRAVKAVSTYRGRDPRDFVLFAFGGNGPIAAAAIASELSIRRIIIPPAPGVFSAFGLPFTQIEHEFIRTVYTRCTEGAGPWLEAVLAEMEAAGRSAAAKDGFAEGEMRVTRLADMRYSGQAYELTISIGDGGVDVDSLAQRFDDEHERTYGHRSLTDPVDIVNLKVKVTGVAKELPAVRCSAPYPVAQVKSSRTAYFGPRGLIDTPVVCRRALGEKSVEGPLIIEEYDSTCVVPPGALTRLDAHGNIEITMPSTC